MIGFWNDEEDAALQGLSPAAQIVYLRALSPAADSKGNVNIYSVFQRAVQCCQGNHDMAHEALSDLTLRVGLMKCVGGSVYHLPLAARGMRQ